MKNKRTKGFTLIELLAIIVILAIIAVITVPIILNVIDNAKKGSIKDSAYGYKDAVSKYYVTKLYENENLKLDGEYIITNGKITGTGMDNVEIPVNGNVPTSGSLVYKNNVLESGHLVIDGYKVIIENGEITSTSKDISTNDSNQNNNTNTDFNTPIEGSISITQDSEEWTTSKVITITTTSTNANLEYQLGGVDGPWIPITSSYQETLTENTTVYARLTNNIETTEPVSLVIEKIDSTPPQIHISSIRNLSYAEIFFTTDDQETGVDSVEVVFGPDTNYGYTGEIIEGGYKIDYLANNLSGQIYYKITVTNTIGITYEYANSFSSNNQFGGSND